MSLTLLGLAIVANLAIPRKPDSKTAEAAPTLLTADLQVEAPQRAGANSGTRHLSISSAY